MKNRLDIKRIYFHMRQGWNVIAPVFGFSNFIMLIYLSLNSDIPIHIFAPPIGVLIVVSLILTGKVFRDKQQATDFNLNYFKAKEAIYTDMIQLNSSKKIMEKLDLIDTEEYSQINARIKTIKDAVEN